MDLSGQVSGNSIISNSMQWLHHTQKAIPLSFTLWFFLCMYTSKLSLFHLAICYLDPAISETSHAIPSSVLSCHWHDSLSLSLSLSNFLYLSLFQNIYIILYLSLSFLFFPSCCLASTKLYTCPMGMMIIHYLSKRNFKSYTSIFYFFLFSQPIYKRCILKKLLFKHQQLHATF